MSRRRLLVFGLLATLTGLGVGGWLLWASVNARTIRPGMTTKEVRAILGRENVSFTTGEVSVSIWMNQRTTVHFDCDGVAQLVENEPLLDRVRRWLRL